MSIGTKSLLFGVHQFLWHPFTVARAWRRLYRRWPRGAEWLAIFFHDTGYWGMPNIDGREGRMHPVAGALRTEFWARRLKLPHRTACDLALYHSREFAKMDNAEPSALCWPDKYCIAFDPKWFFLLRAKLSGEVKEFKARAVISGHLPAEATDGQWYDWYRARVCALPEIAERL